MPYISSIGSNLNLYTLIKRKDQKAPGELSEEEKREVEELKRRDLEVRRHEMAHVMASSGDIVSGPHYEYRRGPDGRLYAVGGEVSIDASIPEDPDEAIRKAQAIRRAALAPLNPSQEDMRIAAEASRIEMEARREKIEEMREELEEGEDRGVQELEGVNNIMDELTDRSGIDRDMITPEIERKIIDKKRLNPLKDVRAIKRELEEEGIEVSEEEIRRVLREHSLEEEGRDPVLSVLKGRLPQNTGDLGRVFDFVV